MYTTTDYTSGLVTRLVLTLVAYSLLPILFAAIRKKPIKKSTYRLWCFVINISIHFLFFTMVMGSYNIVPCILWTTIAVKLGLRILEDGGALLDANIQQEAEENLERKQALFEQMSSDEKFDEAVRFVIDTRKATAHNLHTQMGIDLGTCAEMLDTMEHLKIIGPFQGERPRAILMTIQQWETIKPQKVTVPPVSVGDKESTIPLNQETRSISPDSVIENTKEESPFDQQVTNEFTPAATLYCRKCGFKLLDNSRFCSHCGASTEVEGVMCPKCGTAIAPGEVYCHHCGTKVRI